MDYSYEVYNPPYKFFIDPLSLYGDTQNQVAHLFVHKS